METTDPEQKERKDKIYKVTLVGTFANLGLMVFKFIAGVLGHSGAMIADAIHSLSDFVSDIIVLVFVGISSKPQDKTHDFGHGKYETLATAIIGIVLFAVGIGIFRKGCQDIWAWWNGDTLGRPGMVALIAAIVSIVVKEGLYQYTRIAGRSLKSDVLYANAWHHRSDALSSLATTIGIGGAIILGEKWRVLDPAAAVLVSVLIMVVAYKLTIPCLGELLEKSLPDDVERRILEIAGSNPAVKDPHNLRTRKVGQKRVVDLHVRMDGDMQIRQSHRIITDIEREIRSMLGGDAIITIHVEPTKDVAGN